MRQGNLFVISGPSGAGKGTLVARLLKGVADTWVSVSATTRKPRPGEKEGVDYHFVSEAEFDRLVEQDGLLEWACVHGQRYGTPRKAVEEHISLGQQVILEIDVQGAFQVRSRMPEACLVFIEPPDMETLETRLRKRGTEPDDVIERRMETAKLELSSKMQYDIQLVNDELDKAAEMLVTYVEKQTERG